MAVGRTGGRAGGGFTLVELITVVAILCILITLVISAIVGIGNYQRRVATLEMFETLDSALKMYYDDWNAYPHPSVTNTNGYGAVNTAALLPNYSSIPAEDQNEAVLFAALMVRQRHGPYFTSGATEAILKTVSSAKYYVLPDGWGRKLRYARDTTKTPPVLESDGADVTNADDNMKNW
jgi:prepilin-type N-terminal cleavage/methylation domain-containing protein